MGKKPDAVCPLSRRRKFKPADENPVGFDCADIGDHGGLTPTYEPAPDSVAVDGGGSQQCLPLDQRGYLRPAGHGCDAGSVEVGAIADTLFRDGFDG